jgi:hypothetical protein
MVVSMLRLVESDPEGRMLRVLAQLDAMGLEQQAALRTALAELLCTRRAGGRNARVTARRLAELFELPEDDILGLVAEWNDQRVLVGDPPGLLGAKLAHLQTFFDLCAHDGLPSVDLGPLREALNSKALPPLDASASREALMELLLSDPYHRTVVRRLFGILGVLPTQAFLLDLATLALTREDEPFVARLIASLPDEVVDAHEEIIEPLRQRKGT